MEQKVFDFHFDVDSYGNVDFDVNDEISKLQSEGWTVKQISSCSSCSIEVNKESITKIHFFLLAEKLV